MLLHAARTNNPVRKAMGGQIESNVAPSDFPKTEKTGFVSIDPARKTADQLDKAVKRHLGRVKVETVGSLTWATWTRFKANGRSGAACRRRKLY
jgi:hypothetical protein